SPRWIDDTAEVVTEFKDEGFTRVVLVGLCSGAYTALEGAFHNEVAGVIAINPILSSAEMNKASPTRDARRRAFRPLPVPLARLAAPHGRTAWSIWTAYQQIRPRAAPMAVIADVLKRGPQVMLVLAEVDRPPFDVVWYWRLRARYLDKTGRFTRKHFLDLDHPALVAAGRIRLMQELTQYVALTWGTH
ncbi:MAG: alpha/beta fold hydrolase, partial [Lacisediminihabitans sp.]